MRREGGGSTTSVAQRSSAGNAAGAARAVDVAIFGAAGRMGTRLLALAAADDRFRVAGAIDRGAPPSDLSFDVLIDFSSPEGTEAARELAVSRRAALLVGTTGLRPETLDGLRRAAREVPVLLAANTSLGVAVLRHLVREAVRLLPGFDIDIVESHHKAKRDAPSGTALALAAAASSAGRTLPPEHLHALRGGDIVGEHTVQFAGPGETIRLEHVAVSRDLFALGALRAAAWLAGRPPGWYAMEDVVGLAPSPA